MSESRLHQLPRVELDVALRLTSAEIRALDALACYGLKAFLQVFYAQMGRNYLQPHEEGLKSLFNTIQAELPALMRRHEAARKAFGMNHPVILSRDDHDALVRRATDAEAALALVVKPATEAGTGAEAAPPTNQHGGDDAR